MRSAPYPSMLLQPDSPPTAAPPILLTSGLTLLLFLSIGVAAASIHFNTPMLAVLAHEFGASSSAVGWVPTVTLGGFALGILLLVPLGDRFDKKTLIVAKHAGLIIALAAMAMAPSLIVLAIASFFAGIFATASQDTIPLAAQLAVPAERGRVVGTVLSGLLLGILLGRVAGGFVSDQFGWRTTYWLAAGLIAVMWPLMIWRLPKVISTSAMSYRELIISVFALVRNNAELRRASIIQGLLALCYGGFWNTLAPMMLTLHGLGSSAAGLIGIPGAAGMLIANPVGRWVDRRGARPAVKLGVLLVLAAYIVFGLAGVTVVAIAIGAALLDCGIRATAVANQAHVTGIDAAARSRMNTVFMSHVFGGNALGALIGSYAWTHGGWPAVAGCGVAFACAAWAVHTLTK